MDNLEDIRATTVAEVGTPGRADPRPAARRARRVPAVLRRPGRVLRVDRGPRRRRADGHPVAPLDRAGGASAWSAPSRPGTSPTSSTSPRSPRRWPPATRSCSRGRRPPRGPRSPSAGWWPRTPTCPPACVNVITSGQNDIGEAITTDPRVDMVTLHRLDRGRQADHGRRRRHREEGLPRAGRQVGPHRPRRRRHARPPRRSAPSASARTPARAAPSPAGCCSPAPATTRASSHRQGDARVDALRRPDRPGQPHGLRWSPRSSASGCSA